MIAKLLGAFLLCNPLGLFLGMIARDAPWYEYGALFGSIVFGMFLGAKHD